MSGGLVDDLQAQIARGQALVVAGAGVASAASDGNPVALWLGLLSSGVAWCEEYVPALPSGWADIVRGLIAIGDVSSLVSAAELVTQRLGGREGGEYRGWLRQTVGSLRLTNRAIPEALGALGVPVATTNYDGLLEQALQGWGTVTWRDGARMHRVVRGDEQAVIHLHGYWDDPLSVVLGVNSYEAMLGHGAAQALEHAVVSMRSLVLVGVGAGADDPNVAALRAWLARTFPGGEYRHFRLCLKSEEEGLAAEHRGERILPVAYGTDHRELAEFLRRLGPARQSPVPLPARPPTVRGAGGLSELQLPARDMRNAELGDEVRLPRPPDPPPVWVGRQAKRTQLRRALSEPGLVVLHGEGGVGKSALAASVCRDLLRGEFSENLAWVDFDGFPEDSENDRLFSQCLRQIAKSLLGRPLTRDDDLADRIGEHIDRNRCLIVLDNVGPNILGPRLLDWIRDTGRRAHLLLVTRGVPPRLQCRSVDLRELSLHDSSRLFQSLWRGRSPTDPSSRETIAMICHEVGHLPLALELVASRRLPLPTLLDTVRTKLASIASQEQEWAGPARQRSISACLRVSYDPLDERARRLFVELSVLPGGFGMEILTAVASGTRWAETAEQLVDAALWRLQSDRYTVHPLTRRFGLEELGDRRAEVERRIAAIVVTWLEEKGRLAEPSVPHGQRLAALDAIENDWRNVIACAEIVTRNGDLDLLGRISDSLRDLSWQRGYWEDCVPILRRVLEGRRAAWDPVPLSRALECLGLVYQRAGEWPEAAAYFQETLDVLEVVREPPSSESRLTQCRAMYGLGLASAATGDLDRAEQHLTAAIEAAQAIKSPAAEGIALSNLGVVYINRREWERAKQSLQKSLVIRQTIGDRPGEGDIYLRLATVEEIQGDFASARQHSERAVELFREMHNRIDEMLATLRMCDMLRELGQWTQAVGLSEEALAEFRRQGHHAYYESMALNQIGMTRLLQCRFDDTVKLSSASVRCSMSCGDVVGEALGHLAAGMAHAELRSIEQARSELERSRDLFELRTDFIMGARVRLALAVLEPGVDPAGSTAMAVEAREVLEDSGDVVGAALAHVALGSIHASGGDATVARHHFAEALAVLSGFRAARVRVKVAELELGRGNHREAIAALDEARRNSLGTDDDWTRREIRRLRAEVRGRGMSVDG